MYLISLEIERSDLVAQAVYLERSGDHHPIDSQEGSLGRMLGDLCLESWFSSQTQTSPWVLVELRTRESPSLRRKIQKSTGFPGIITYDPPNSCSKRPAPWHAMAIEFQHRIQNSEQKSCLGHPRSAVLVFREFLSLFSCHSDAGWSRFSPVRNSKSWRNHSQTPECNRAFCFLAFQQNGIESKSTSKAKPFFVQAEALPKEFQFMSGHKLPLTISRVA